MIPVLGVTNKFANVHIGKLSSSEGNSLHECTAWDCMLRDIACDNTVLVKSGKPTLFLVSMRSSCQVLYLSSSTMMFSSHYTLVVNNNA